MRQTAPDLTPTAELALLDRRIQRLEGFIAHGHFVHPETEGILRGFVATLQADRAALVTRVGGTP